MKHLWQYIKPEKWRIVLEMCFKMGGTFIELLLPSILSQIIDVYVPNKDVKMLWTAGCFMVLCALAAWIGNVTANKMATRISADITKKYRHDLFEKIEQLSSHQIDEFSVASLVSRMTSDTYYVHQMVDRTQRLGVRAPILLMGGIAITFTLDPVLASVFLVVLPVLACVVGFVTTRGIVLYSKTQKSSDKMVNKIQENMTGVRIIKALAKTDYEKKAYDVINDEIVENDTKAGNLMAVSSPTMNFCLYCGLAAVIVLGAKRVQLGLTGAGTIVAFLSYFTTILNSLMAVTRLFMMLTKGSASAKRIEEVFEAPMDLQIEDLPFMESENKIEFKNVSFSYNKISNDVADLNFALKPGETLGIIGPTGSGKSTILQLLMRFYDPDEGQILIDGRDIRSIDEKQLHNKFGVVFQNDFIFEDTIRENISFWRSLDINDNSEAIADAQADFIFKKPDGLDTQLTIKGSNLSGGQKQRVLIARALAANNEILLLDDCSSALDYKTDAKLRMALRKREKQTTIIVAQRISSIMFADKIIVLEKGRIVGYGTHKDLLENCKSYKDIYDIQMGDEQ